MQRTNVQVKQSGVTPARANTEMAALLMAATLLEYTLLMF
ncbi:hypothetical protein DES37_102397 [Mangrovibacter plantisponsor]|uniref:Uncharacterized protein n=1 Tax=Mangrovibacter plantisponsor TaxID=451513 RepID=A0A317QB69_9ENTR|nr:hypothetical protein DES37_102397 [Mangrovibacter plantisponsor]